MAWEAIDPHDIRDAGPQYNVTSAALQKFRSRAREGLAALSYEERRAYGEAVEKAVLAAQRAQLARAAVPEKRSNCASGTWFTTGEEIHAAVRAQQNARLLAAPAKERRERSPQIWKAMYAEAMEEKTGQLYQEREAA